MRVFASGRRPSVPPHRLPPPPGAFVLIIELAIDRRLKQRPILHALWPDKAKLVFSCLCELKLGRFDFAMIQNSPWDKAREIFFSRIAHAKTPAMRRRREEEYAQFVEFLGTQAADYPFLAAMQAELQNDLLAFDWFAAAQAKKILDAARVARAGGPQRPKPTGLAAKIIEAGKKRRGEA
jgi:hypothetical protein